MVREGLSGQMTFQLGPMLGDVAMQTSGGEGPGGAVSRPKKQHKDFVAGMNFGYLQNLLLKFIESEGLWYG